MLHWVCILYLVLIQTGSDASQPACQPLFFLSLGNIVKGKLKTRGYLHYKNSQIVSKENRCTHHKKTIQMRVRPFYMVWTHLTIESVVNNSESSSAQ